MTCTQPGGPEPFREAAPFYHHRLPYPRAMLDDLRSRVGVTGSGRLLDLGCGDGRVSVPLAPSFAEVWAVDVEAAMLEEGRKRAKKAGATNVRWILSRAKDVEIPAASVDLITAGESFHRMDQTVVAEQAMNWLRTGGHFAILWYVNFYRRAEPWHTIVEDVVSRWKERLPSSPVAQPYPRNYQPFEEILEDAGFGGVASFEFSTPHDWALDDIIGQLYSRSNVRRSLIDHTDAFETDLKKALLTYDPTGTFHEIAQFGYLLARRPY